ncbi:MAG: CBO0543 family protein [Bacillota bacterium]
MERIFLWALFLIGIALLFFSLRKPSIKDWILIFLLSAYLSTFIGVLVVEEKMLRYPNRILSKYFDTNLLYEYFLFPVVCIYFYQTTYSSRYFSIALQCALYTTALTIIEVLFERYTNLIEYHTWTWMHTFISTFFLMIFVRILMQLINKKER